MSSYFRHELRKRVFSQLHEAAAPRRSRVRGPSAIAEKRVRATSGESSFLLRSYDLRTADERSESATRLAREAS